MTIARRARYGRIERMVEELLVTHGVASRPPVPIEAIVKAHSISLRRGDFGDVSGLLLRDAETAVIGVNGSHPKTRQRFTVAHEFGHFLLHEGIVDHVDRGYRVNYRNRESSLARDVEEIEANFFAASLLMPRSMLEKLDAVSAIDSDRGVRDLAKTFEVSAHAMSLRLANVYSEHAPF